MRTTSTWGMSEMPTGSASELARPHAWTSFKRSASSPALLPIPGLSYASGPDFPRPPTAPLAISKYDQHIHIEGHQTAGIEKGVVVSELCFGLVAFAVSFCHYHKRGAMRIIHVRTCICSQGFQAENANKEWHAKVRRTCHLLLIEGRVCDREKEVYSDMGRCLLDGVAHEEMEVLGNLLGIRIPKNHKEEVRSLWFRFRLSESGGRAWASLDLGIPGLTGKRGLHKVLLRFVSIEFVNLSIAKYPAESFGKSPVGLAFAGNSALWLII